MVPGDRDLGDATQIILEEYTKNLRSIIELARAHQVQVILITLVSNLYEFPVRSEGWNRVRVQRLQAKEPVAPWLEHFAAGIELHRAERFEEALAQFKLARDTDPRSRAPGVLNPRIRELTAAYSHVHLVDFERELDRLGLKEGIGCNFFGDETRAYSSCEGVHPNPHTNEFIGEAAARKVIQLRRTARPGTS
jgi:hypothetical protein